MEPFEHFRNIWRWRWLLLAFSAIAAITAFAVLQARPVEWRASAVVRIVQPLGTLTGESLQIAEHRYTDLAGSQAVLRDARARAGLDASLDEVEARLEIARGEGTGLITITAKGDSPETALGLAQGTAAALVEASRAQRTWERQLELQPVQDSLAAAQGDIDRAPPDSAAQRAAEAKYESLLQALREMETRPSEQLETRVGTAPEDGREPSALRGALLALLISLVVGAEVAVLAAAARDRFIRGEAAEQLAALTGAPVMAAIPPEPGRELEALWGLRSALTSLMTERETGSLALICLGPPNLAINAIRELAMMLAADRRVVLLGVDLSVDGINDGVGARARPGQRDDLPPRHASTEEHTAGPVAPGRGSLYVIPEGAVGPGEDAAVSIARVALALDDLSADLGTAVDLVLAVGGGPTLSTPSVVAAARCDGAILLVSTRTVRRRAARAAIDRLTNAGANLVGVVADERSPNLGSTPHSSSGSSAEDDRDRRYSSAGDKWRV